MEGKRSAKEALYQLNISAEKNHPRTEQALKSTRVEPLSLWHQRFGHLNVKSLLKMASEGSVKGLALFNDQLQSSAHCRGCLLGKMCRSSFQSTRIKSTRVGELIHSDVCGPMQVATPFGERYYVIFKDDFSGWCEIKLLKKKSDVSIAFKNFSAKLQSETGKKASTSKVNYSSFPYLTVFSQQIKTLRSDGGGEYCGNEFQNWLAKAGISHQVTPPYTPQLNAVAERGNRTIVESARSQMYGKKVPLELWGFAVQCAVYVQNRAPPSAGHITPFELWHKRRPDISHLKVFGCLAFVHVPDEKRRKLDPKAVGAMMVGYVEGSSSCYQVGSLLENHLHTCTIFTLIILIQVWDPIAKKLITSRDIIFEELSTMEPTGEQIADEEEHYYSIFPNEIDQVVLIFFSYELVDSDTHLYPYLLKKKNSDHPWRIFQSKRFMQKRYRP